MARFIPALTVVLTSFLAFHLIFHGIGAGAVSPQHTAAPRVHSPDVGGVPAVHEVGEPLVLPVAHFSEIPFRPPSTNQPTIPVVDDPVLLRRVPPVDSIPENARVRRGPPPAMQRARAPLSNEAGSRFDLTSMPLAGSPTAVDWLNESSLNAVATQGDAMIQRAFALAEKGAHYSARAELKRALRAIVQAVDAYSNTSQHSQRLEDGFQALKEADDFLGGRNRPAGAGIAVTAIVATHRTPVMKGYDLSQTPAVVAMQHYYTYAQERLAQAAGGAPIASRLMYALGKIHVAMSEKNASTLTTHGPRAVAFHQAALMVDPTNYRAANELGVLLARFGQLREARTVLQHSVTTRPVPETWHNLATVHQRLGEFDLAQRAGYELSRAQQQMPAASGAASSPLVQWVDPRTFSTMGYVGAPAPARPPAVQPKTAKKPSQFWTW